MIPYCSTMLHLPPRPPPSSRGPISPNHPSGSNWYTFTQRNSSPSPPPAPPLAFECIDYIYNIQFLASKRLYATMIVLLAFGDRLSTACILKRSSRLSCPQRTSEVIQKRIQKRIHCRLPLPLPVKEASHKRKPRATITHHRFAPIIAIREPAEEAPRPLSQTLPSPADSFLPFSTPRTGNQASRNAYGESRRHNRRNNFRYLSGKTQREQPNAEWYCRYLGSSLKRGGDRLQFCRSGDPRISEPHTRSRHTPRYTYPRTRRWARGNARCAELRISSGAPLCADV